MDKINLGLTIPAYPMAVSLLWRAENSPNDQRLSFKHGM
jgi:hypothetical protein